MSAEGAVAGGDNAGDAFVLVALGTTEETDETESCGTIQYMGVLFVEPGILTGAHALPEGRGGNVWTDRIP